MVARFINTASFFFCSANFPNAVGNRQTEVVLVCLRIQASKNLREMAREFQI